MADLRIEKKEKSSSILPWLLGLLVLALAIWGVIELLDDDDDNLVENTEVIDDGADAGSDIVRNGNTYTLIDFDDPQAGERFGDLTNEYSTYTENMTGEMGLDHEFSHNALNQLANATVALAYATGMGEETNIKQKAAMIRERAEAITRDPMATTHADDIRAAATSISEVLSEVQRAHYPGLDAAVAEVSKAASEITPQTLTLNQKEDVRVFFGKAKVALEAMRDQQPQTM